MKRPNGQIDKEFYRLPTIAPLKRSDQSILAWHISWICSGGNVHTRRWGEQTTAKPFFAVFPASAWRFGSRNAWPFIRIKRVVFRLYEPCVAVKPASVPVNRRYGYKFPAPCRLTKMIAFPDRRAVSDRFGRFALPS